MNPFDIPVACIIIAKSELLFEQYRMALNRDKYDIGFRDYDAINRNQIFFDFMQGTFNCMDGLCLCGRYLLIDMIMKDQFREHSAAEIEKWTENKRLETK